MRHTVAYACGGSISLLLTTKRVKWRDFCGEMLWLNTEPKIDIIIVIILEGKTGIWYSRVCYTKVKASHLLVICFIVHITWVQLDNNLPQKSGIISSRTETDVSISSCWLGTMHDH